MRIAILGTGVVARAFHAGWTRHGHDVVLGTREPESSASREELARLPLTTFAEAVTGADLVVLALLGTATIDVVTSLASGLEGTVVVDATNPLRFTEAGIELFVGTSDSLGEQVQRAAPGARVVKAYNSVGNALFVDPQLPGGPPTMFIAGDDAAAKAVVTELLTATGWEAVDSGDITASRWLEPLCVLWVGYGRATGTWTHAFKLLTS